MKAETRANAEQIADALREAKRLRRELLDEARETLKRAAEFFGAGDLAKADAEIEKGNRLVEYAAEARRVIESAASEIISVFRANAEGGEK